MRTTLILALACAIALAACGSDASDAPDYPSDAPDEEQIQAVVDRFNAAVGDLDAALLCDEVIPPSVRDVSVDECAQAVQPAMDDEPDNWREITDVGSVAVAGRSATADAVQGGDQIQLHFDYEQERWWMRVFD